MSALKRNNVVVRGSGSGAMIFAHGYGCDQNMWRYITPAFEQTYRTVLFDHIGAGKSDLTAFDKDKYATLDGYAQDVLDIIDELKLTDVVFVGHSVSAMIGALAAAKRPELFKKLILVGPSPRYVNDGDYIGGFTRDQIDELLLSLEDNHFGWSRTMAPVIMANPDRAELGEELATSFCSMDPEIAKHFARTTFLDDSRAVLSSVLTPSLILQCANDIIAPAEVGDYVHQSMPNSTLKYMEATGHCPHLSAPEETITLMREYLHG